MTPEEIEELQMIAIMAARDIRLLNERVEKCRVVELELRGLLSESAMKKEYFDEEKESRSKWREHVDIANSCNIRMAVALENLVDIILRKL